MSHDLSQTCGTYYCGGNVENVVEERDNMVPHRYGFTQGFQVMGHVGTGMVSNLGTCVKTVPLTMVSWVLTVLQLIWLVHRLHFNFRVLLGVAGYETSTRNIIIILLS